MSLPRYPEYKDSRVAWLGKIPTHWEVRPLKGILSTPITDGPHETPVFGDEGVPFVSAEAVSSGVIDFGKIRGHISLEDHNRFSLKYKPLLHDIYMVKSGATTGVTAIVETDKEFNIWSPLAAIRCNAQIALPYFVLNFLRSRNFQEAVALNWSFGTQQNIGMGVLGDLPIVLPPGYEQTAIATFLDRETGKIDTLISEQEKLLVLLAEKRQATISHAVTKGLNPDAPMKDSGVAWLGEVPEHWEVGPIKRWYATSSGGTPDTAHQDEYYIEEGGYPWIRTTDLNNDRLDNYEIAITDEAIRNSACSMLPANSVLVAMYGGDGTIGKNALLTIEACINQAVCALLPTEDFDSRYTFRYVQFYRPYWMVGAESSRKDPNISQALIRNVSILCPPIGEQTAIAEFLDTETTKLDALKAESEHAIDLLKERRSALIAAAVTGQIDVRGLVTEPEAA